MIINDYDFEDMKKKIHHLSLKRSMRMNNTRRMGYKTRVIKYPMIYMFMHGTGTRISIFTESFKMMR